jgi:porphobilinogen deaminase
MGAFAEASDDGVLKLTACIASVDGRRLIRASQSGMIDAPQSIAEALETTLVSAGAREILAQLQPRRSAGKKKPARRRPAKKAKARR